MIILDRIRYFLLMLYEIPISSSERTKIEEIGVVDRDKQAIFNSGNSTVKGEESKDCENKESLIHQIKLIYKHLICCLKLFYFL